ncbi:flagellar basal body rod protein FlgB [Phenylobacterium sp.]|jgi:flagellar basal-body rod protein FlgB|uniref:flagellar basal body rod protein FlgB n=1 Tax=Phenylobacterium sp. TaxID=1871053 RepID=UPI002CFCE14A|nr:flagellar basal body rod protein FlgB [Phenylobacterium sp.]
MDVADIPLFSMLRGRLGHLSERQRLIAQNVANSETPGYQPQDLKPYSFAAQVKGAQMAQAGAPARTQAAHLAGTVSPGRAGAGKPLRTKDSETTLDGNSVVLEEQMLKMSEARVAYDAAVGFYQKSLNLLRTAARPPGRG